MKIWGGDDKLKYLDYGVITRVYVYVFFKNV